jgi:hypothetical protein
VEDPQYVLERRVVGALLVVVVEPVELGEDQPDRQGREEDDVLVADRQAVGGAAGAERELGQDERGGQPGDVGDQQRPADERPAALDARALAPLIRSAPRGRRRRR